ncbi:MAG: prolyl oligopeptidase family serine peptidase [Clostridia bacterium]|nr:prolyl oligopeptidase family serine peptidase [Clostridia bacterium]
MEWKEFKLGKLRYVIHYPDGFAPDKPHPVLFVLNGAGSRGNDITPCVNVRSVTLGAPNFPEYPFVTVVPLCHTDNWFDLFEHLEDLVRLIASQSYTDRKRIYMMGASMGGYATWQLAMSMPEYFAAIAPICGGGMYWESGRLANVAVWAFHGGKDPLVLCRESEIFVETINLRGGNAKLTVYPENAHDAWTDTFSNPEVYQWFLSHEKTEAAPMSDEFRDSVKFG